MKKTVRVLFSIGLFGFTFFTQGYGQNTFPASGNVGIGTTSPTTTLDVRGTIRSGSYLVGTGNVNAFKLELGGPSPTNSSGQATLYFHHHNTIAHQLRYSSGTLYWEAAGNGYGTSSTPNFMIGGNVGIGTTTTGNFKLAVEGKIGAREVQVTLANPWPDYVFTSEYKLPSLLEVEKHIRLHGHLPQVPSASEIEKDGLKLGEMDAILLRKIEELTLYMIELKKENQELRNQIQTLKKQ